LFSQGKFGILPVGYQKGEAMKQKADVLQGTLGLMVLKTLDVLGPLHGWDRAADRADQRGSAGREPRHFVSRPAETGAGGRNFV
jgi:hypothetical protein